MALRLFFDSLRWQILLIVAAMVVLMVLLSSSLRPLLDLSEAVRRRRPDDLTPVLVSDVPSARPLIDAINNHLARLVHMLQARRRFLADAAHQIRTPLAVLGTQADYGVRQLDPEEMRRTFAGMQASIRGTRHLANQMLTLARAEQAEHLLQDRQTLDFAELVREVAGDFRPAGGPRDRPGVRRRRSGGEAERQRHDAARRGLQPDRQRPALYPGGRARDAGLAQGRGATAADGLRRRPGNRARGA